MGECKISNCCCSILKVLFLTQILICISLLRTYSRKVRTHLFGDSFFCRLAHKLW